MGGEEAKRLYQHFFNSVKAGYAQDKVKDGVFQAMMEVALVNDGPVFMLLFPPPISRQVILTRLCRLPWN